MDHQTWRGLGVVLALVSAFLVLAAAVSLTNRLLTSRVAFVGLDEGVVVTAHGLREIGLKAVGGDDLAGVEVLVDGARAAVRAAGERLVLAEPVLADGRHVITARVPSVVPLLPGDEVSFEFVVDSGAPAVAVDAAQVGG